MVIARERYLDDTTRYLLTLALQSRTAEMHGVLTALTPEQEAAVAGVLVRALDELAALTARLVPARVYR